MRHSLAGRRCLSLLTTMVPAVPAPRTTRDFVVVVMLRRYPYGYPRRCEPADTQGVTSQTRATRVRGGWPRTRRCRPPRRGRPAYVVVLEVRTSLADAEAREGGRLGAALLEHLADRLLGVLGEGLLEQDVLLVEAVDATLDDAGKGGLGLALLLGRGLGDAALVLDRLGGDLLAREDRGAEGRDVHRDVATDGLVAALQGHEDTDLRGQVGARLVEVGDDLLALEAGDPADLDLLADGRVGLVEQLLDGPAVPERALEERVGVGGTGGHGLREDLVGEGDELLTLGDEVRLAVDLDQRADAVAGLGGHEAVGGRAALTLRDALEALDAQDLDGLGAVAVGLVEGLLDVHHSGTGRRVSSRRLGRRLGGGLGGGVDRDLGGDLGGRRLDGRLGGSSSLGVEL